MKSTVWLHPEYQEDIKYVASLDLEWQKLNGKSLLLSGATGLVGSFLVDVLLYKNKSDGLNCKVYAMGRSVERLKKRFEYASSKKDIVFVEHDINFPLCIDNVDVMDYVLHLASHTHPLAYSTDPIGTIETNILGTMNMLNFAVSHQATRFSFASSNEIYGENRGDVEFFDEDYCGYINSNTLRAGYPESKRCAEALCQAYKVQKSLDIVVARLTRSYGPTLLSSDTKALSQFLNRGSKKQNIILKSEGNQYYSYLYVADSVSGLLTVLLSGENGEAYNIADRKSDIQLKDLAQCIADLSGTKVIFELPDKIESRGYSVATKARLDSTKLQKLGWNAKYDISEGIARTLNIWKD